MYKDKNSTHIHLKCFKKLPKLYLQKIKKIYQIHSNK